MHDEATMAGHEPSLAGEPLDAATTPGPSARRQLAVMVAFLAAAAILLVLVGGVDAVGQAATHLLPHAEGCGGG